MHHFDSLVFTEVYKVNISKRFSEHSEKWSIKMAHIKICILLLLVLNLPLGTAKSLVYQRKL